MLIVGELVRNTFRNAVCFHFCSNLASVQIVKACFTADCDAQYNIHLLRWMWQGFRNASSTISYLIHNSLSPLHTEVLKQRCVWRIILVLVQQVKYYILCRLKWIYSFIKYSLCTSQRTLCASIRKTIWWMFYNETMTVFSLRITWETQKRCVDGMYNLLILNLAVHTLVGWVAQSV